MTKLTDDEIAGFISVFVLMNGSNHSLFTDFELKTYTRALQNPRKVNKPVAKARLETVRTAVAKMGGDVKRAGKALLRMLEEELLTWGQVSWAIGRLMTDTRVSASTTSKSSRKRKRSCAAEAAAGAAADDDDDDDDDDIIVEPRLGAAAAAAVPDDDEDEEEEDLFGGGGGAAAAAAAPPLKRRRAFRGERGAAAAAAADAADDAAAADDESESVQCAQRPPRSLTPTEPTAEAAPGSFPDPQSDLDPPQIKKPPL